MMSQTVMSINRLEVHLRTDHELTGRGVVRAGARSPWVQPIDLIVRGVDTRELGDGKEVARRSVDAYSIDVLLLQIQRIAEAD